MCVCIRGFRFFFGGGFAGFRGLIPKPLCQSHAAGMYVQVQWLSLAVEGGGGV